MLYHIHSLVFHYSVPLDPVSLPGLQDKPVLASHLLYREHPHIWHYAGRSVFRVSVCNFSLLFVDTVSTNILFLHLGSIPIKKCPKKWKRSTIFLPPPPRRIWTLLNLGKIGNSMTPPLGPNLGKSNCYASQAFLILKVQVPLQSNTAWSKVGEAVCLE